MRGKGWSVKAPERRKGYYTVYVYDPNLAGNGGYVSKLGLGGILGYNEATGQEWKLYHRQRPADEAKDAQQAVWSETPVLITPPTPEPAPMPEPVVQPPVAAKPQQLSLF